MHWNDLKCGDIVEFCYITKSFCFPKRPSGAPLHILSKLYDVPVGFVPPPPILRLNIAYFAVAEGWLLLDIGWFVLFFFWKWRVFFWGGGGGMWVYFRPLVKKIRIWAVMKSNGHYITRNGLYDPLKPLITCITLNVLWKDKKHPKCMT